MFVLNFCEVQKRSWWWARSRVASGGLRGRRNGPTGGEGTTGAQMGSVSRTSSPMVLQFPRAYGMVSNVQRRGRSVPGSAFYSPVLKENGKTPMSKKGDASKQPSKTDEAKVYVYIYIYYYPIYVYVY